MPGVPTWDWLASLAVMSWTWQLEDPAGAPVDPATLGVEVPECENQGDAESWLGEAWRDLLDVRDRDGHLLQGGRGARLRPDGPGR